MLELHTAAEPDAIAQYLIYWVLTNQHINLFEMISYLYFSISTHLELRTITKDYV